MDYLDNNATKMIHEEKCEIRNISWQRCIESKQFYGYVYHQHILTILHLH